MDVGALLLLEIYVASIFNIFDKIDKHLSIEIVMLKIAHRKTIKA